MAGSYGRIEVTFSQKSWPKACGGLWDVCVGRDPLRYWQLLGFVFQMEKYVLVEKYESLHHDGGPTTTPDGNTNIVA